MDTNKIRDHPAGIGADLLRGPDCYKVTATVVSAQGHRLSIFEPPWQLPVYMYPVMIK
jgi:hypothetical protein